MALYNTEAVVLRTINFSETDKLCTLYSRNFGKVKCVAKSARRLKSRYGAALEPLSYIKTIYFGKEGQELYRLNHCDILKSFQSVREDIGKLYTGVYFLELVDTLVHDGESAPHLFDFILEALRQIQKQKDLEILRRMFEIRFISLLGYLPNLSVCLICKKEPGKSGIGFNFQRGGIVCPTCRPRELSETHFSVGTWNYLKKLLTFDIQYSDRIKLPKALQDEIEQVTHRMILSHTGRELKSYPFIKQMVSL